MKSVRRPSESALVLVDDRQRSDDALGPPGTLEEAKAIELRCLGARPTGQRVLAA
jgi:hypothetical protein